MASSSLAFYPRECGPNGWGVTPVVDDDEIEVGGHSNMYARLIIGLVDDVGEYLSPKKPESQRARTRLSMSATRDAIEMTLACVDVRVTVQILVSIRCFEILEKPTKWKVNIRIFSYKLAR